jgi:hypothetical protein
MVPRAVEEAGHLLCAIAHQPSQNYRHTTIPGRYLHDGEDVLQYGSQFNTTTIIRDGSLEYSRVVASETVSPLSVFCCNGQE